jgi:hypothetical protein
MGISKVLIASLLKMRSDKAEQAVGGATVSWAFGSWLAVVLAACNIYDPSLLEHAERPLGASGLSGNGSTGAGPSGSLGGTSSSGGAGSANIERGGAGAGPNDGVAGSTLVSGGTGPASGGTGAAIGGSSAVGGSSEDGGSGSSGGTTTASGGGGSSSVALDLIDDMEDDDNVIILVEGRSGVWDTFDDSTPGAMQLPATGQFEMKLLDVAPHQNDRYSAYTKGSGFTAWGAFMTVYMKSDLSAYDASAFSGLAFYARIGAGTDSTMRVRFVGSNTDPSGGQCDPNGSVQTACYDHFLQEVTGLSNTWSHYELYFVNFHQTGVGKQFASIDLRNMLSLDFLFPGETSGNNFELWVDDLAFIKAN